MHRRFWRVLTIVLTLFVCVSYAAAVVQNREASKNSGSAKSPVTRKSRQPAKSVILTIARQNAALTFAQAHHPELASLLRRLRKRQPSQYNRGILELHRTSERLNRLKEANSDRYESSLQLWKLESRIRLLAARMTMSTDPGLEAQIRSLLQEHVALRHKRLTTERDRLQTRVNKLNSQIDDIVDDPDAAEKRQFERLEKSLGRAIL